MYSPVNHVAQAAESAERNATYSSMRAVPGNLVEVNAVEEERYLATALFGLAGSPTGRSVILRHPATIRGELRVRQSLHKGAGKALAKQRPV